MERLSWPGHRSVPGDSSPGSPPSPAPLPGPHIEAAASQECEHHHYSHHAGRHLPLAHLGPGRGGGDCEVEPSEAAHLLLWAGHEEDPQPPGGGGCDGLTDLPAQRGLLGHVVARVPGLHLDEGLQTVTCRKKSYKCYWLFED